MKSDLDKWAENLTKEVYDEWKTKYSYWNSGFRVFYSPIKYKPSLLIISLNPGGGPKDFEKHHSNFKNKNFSLDKENVYVTRNRLFAKKVRLLFEHNEDALQTSVATTVLFFRSKNIKYWKKENPKKTRLKMEQFAYEKVQEIFDKVRPKKILVIGLGVYKRLEENVIKIENETNIESFGSVGCVIIVDSGNIKMLVIPHLTRSRISIKNMEKLKKY